MQPDPAGAMPPSLRQAAPPVKPGGDEERGMSA